MVKIVADLCHPKLVLTQLQAPLHYFSILIAQLTKLALSDFRVQVSIHLQKDLMLSI